MKHSLSIILGGMLLVTASCRDKTSSPTLAPESFWQAIPGANSSGVGLVQATPTSLILSNRQGFLRLDPGADISGRADLNDPHTYDYPLCATDRYAVVLSTFLQTGIESVLAVYDLDRPGQPPLRIPLSQLLKPLYGYSLFGTAVPYNYTGSELVEPVSLLPFGESKGVVDKEGNMLLMFRGYLPDKDCYCLLHYYKFKIATDAQGKLSLTYVSDQADETKYGAGIITHLASINDQLFRIRTVNDNSQPISTQLFRITPQGGDQLLLTAPYEINNVFQLDKTLYIVTSTSELWASTDSGNSWQKNRTLTQADKAFFANCSSSDGTAPLVSSNNGRPLVKSSLDAKTDTLGVHSPSTRQLIRIKQRYYLQSDTLVYYSDHPYNIR